MRVRWHASDCEAFGNIVLHADNPHEFDLLRRWGGYDRAKWKFHIHSYGGTYDQHDSAHGMSICIGFVDRAKWETKPPAPRDPLIFGLSASYREGD